MSTLVGLDLPRYEGATVVDFSLLVTATVFDAARLPDARTAVEAAAAPARLMLRQMFRNQAAAFAQTLPLGVNVRSSLKINAGENL